MGQWLLDVYDLFAKRREQQAKTKDAKDARIDPSLLPGWAYARALALRILENAGKDTVRIGPPFSSSTHC